METLVKLWDWILSWVKTPFFGGFAGAVFAVLLGFYLKERSGAKRHRRNAISILDTYLHELKNGLDWMEKNRDKIKGSGKLDNGIALAVKSWENFKMEPDHLSALRSIKWQFVDDHKEPIKTLPTRLKDCFEHIPVNYLQSLNLLKMHVGKIEGEVAERAVQGFDAYIGGFKLTIALCEGAIERLDY